MIDVIKLRPVTTGAAGSASGSDTTKVPIRGEIVAVHVDWHASAPAGTSDLTLAMAGSPTENILAITNTATDTWYYPRRAVVDSAGAALLHASGGTALVDKYVVHDHLIATVAQSDALDPAAVVTVYVKN